MYGLVELSTKYPNKRNLTNGSQGYVLVGVVSMQLDWETKWKVLLSPF